MVPSSVQFSMSPEIVTSNESSASSSATEY